MTRTSDLEATMEQHKAEVAATIAANTKRLDQMQEMIEKNKAETDLKLSKQHAEVMQLLKALQQPTNTTAAASPSITPPLPTAAISTAAIPSTFPTTAPLPPPFRHTFSMPPPTHPLTLPIITQPSAAYTSFSGLQFDSQGYPIPTTPPNDFIGPFSTWEDHGFHNRRPSVSAESTFQNFPDYSRGVPNGRFSGQLQPIPLNNGYERGWGPGPGADFRLRKLKMPLFEGDDVFGWVYRIERFFDIQRVMTSGERLRAAVLCLEGPALAWFRWTDSRTPFRSWEELKSRMMDRFQPSQEGSLYEQFLNISQEGSARDYVALFEKMAAQLEGIQEEILEGTFIKGLKPDLRTAVRTQQPKGLIQAIKLTLLIDENRSEKVSNSQLVGRIGGGVPRSSVVPTGGTNSKVGSGAAGKQPFKRMSEAEFADKKAKGLCFRCDGKFTPGHKCPEKSLQVLVVFDGETEGGEEEEPETETDEPVQLEMVEVSATSVHGFTDPHTMKPRGNDAIVSLFPP